MMLRSSTDPNLGWSLAIQVLLFIVISHEKLGSQFMIA